MTEYKAHLSVWAVMASPLIHSADLRTVKQRHPECLQLMLNPEILAVNQDPAGLAAKLVGATTNVTGKTYQQVTSVGIVAQVWMRPLAGAKVAVVMFNRAETPQVLSVGWRELGLQSAATARVRDVVERKDLPDATGQFASTVAAHGATFVVLSPRTTQQLR